MNSYYEDLHQIGEIHVYRQNDDSEFSGTKIAQFRIISNSSEEWTKKGVLLEPGTYRIGFEALVYYPVISDIAIDSVRLENNKECTSKSKCSEFLVIMMIVSS